MTATSTTKWPISDRVSSGLNLVKDLGATHEIILVKIHGQGEEIVGYEVTIPKNEFPSKEGERKHEAAGSRS